MEQFASTIASIEQKIHRYLHGTVGRSAYEANDEEFYRALCLSLREELLLNWIATNRSLKEPGHRKIYYLSMEYMPGRLLDSYLTNINASPLVKPLLKKFHRKSSSLAKIEHDIGVGNGGLGRLASCFMDSLATLKYPAMGYGLRYQYGIFEQELVCGVQVERPDCWLMTQNPWEMRQDSLSTPVYFMGSAAPKKNHLETVSYDLINHEEVRAIPFDIPIPGYSNDLDSFTLTLRLWSTKESPRNFHLQRYNAGDFGQAGSNTCLTDVLYPNDNHEEGKSIRLKQEFLLVSASLKDIIRQYKHSYSTFDDFANTVRIQINDTHPALVIPELMHLILQESKMPWGKAWETVKTCCSYTNHTILKEALEEWNIERLQRVLPCQYAIIEHLNTAFCQDIRKTFPQDSGAVDRMAIIQGGQVKMAHLSIYGCHSVNGVAKIHTNILKERLFKDFHLMYPNKFINVTNGVTPRRWLLQCNPLLTDFINQRIGDSWITNFKDIAGIKTFASDKESQNHFLNIKTHNKQRLIEKMQEGVIIPHGISDVSELAHFAPNALLDVHIKRIHEYKRQLMNALGLLLAYQNLKKTAPTNPVKKLVVFAGKAAPGYKQAKNIIRLIYCIARLINNDPDISKYLKVIFIENYNVSLAELIIPATDLSEQISTAGMEASGTGNMKFAINGALTIATRDGANIEMETAITNEWWPFMFGSTAEQNNRLHQESSYNPINTYQSSPIIQSAIDMLENRSLVENNAEHDVLMNIHHSLMSPNGDPFFVLKDLVEYYETQKQVDQLYQSPSTWAEYAIHNMGGMGRFSADVSIENYAKNIWGISPRKIPSQTLHNLRKEFHADTSS